MGRRYSDLEVGQKFTFINDHRVCTKVDARTFTYWANGGGAQPVVVEGLVQFKDPYVALVRSPQGDHHERSE